MNPTTPRPDLAPTRDVARALNTCIEACTDGERGYSAAAADVRDPALRELFLAKAKQRSDFVVALQKALAKLGAYAENQGSVAGAIHRGWLNARLAVEGRSDAIVLEEWVRGEENAIAAYERAFREVPLTTLPDDVTALIRVQLEAIRESLVVARAKHADNVVVRN